MEKMKSDETKKKKRENTTNQSILQYFEVQQAKKRLLLATLCSTGIYLVVTSPHRSEKSIGGIVDKISGSKN